MRRDFGYTRIRKSDELANPVLQHSNVEFAMQVILNTKNITFTLDKRSSSIIYIIEAVCVIDVTAQSI